MGPAEMKNKFFRLSFVPQRLSLLTSLVLITNFGQTSGATMLPCAGSLNVCRFRLLVQPAKGGTPLPLQEINIIDAGEKLKYEPLHLPPAIRDKAKIALVLVAAPKAESKDEVEGREGKGEGEEKAKEAEGGEAGYPRA